jgi:hypothetical protein
MGKNNDLNFIEFSNRIIESGDIDPDYIFLIRHRETFGDSETISLFKKKLLIYNLENELLFQNNLITEDQIKFGNERRKNKRNFKNWFDKLEGVDFSSMIKAFNGKNYYEFKNFFCRLDGMGPWASWKAADIMNKVFGVNFIFSQMSFLEAYEYPLRGLLLLNGSAEDTSQYTNKELYKRHMEKMFELSTKIEPSQIFKNDDLLTLETCLCKWHSYKSNKYTIGEDLEKVRGIKNNKELKKYWDLVW